MRVAADFGGANWAAGDAGALLRVHAAGDRDWIWIRFLFAGGSVEVVHCVSVLPGARRGGFRDVHAVVAGAVPDGGPGQRVCICDLGGAICGCWIYVFRWRGRRALSYDWE